MKNNMVSERFDSISVFNLLTHYGEQVLTNNDLIPVCKYDSILNWREMTNKLGEDIFTTSYLAYNDIYFHENTSVFSWGPLIKHDNQRLNLLLKKGIADNHFHLHGSFQIFPLTWICLMNKYSLIKKVCAEFNKKPLDVDVLSQVNTQPDYWDNWIKRAAIIRAYLFERTLGKEEDNNILNEIKDVWELPYNTKIEALRHTYGYANETNNFILDYALTNNMAEENYNVNRSLVGERNFLYSCFRSVFQNKFSDIECNFFYLYLVIKSSFRGEMIQLNDRVGFKNFQNYQNRKHAAMEYDDNYYKESINLALNSTLENSNLTSLELRIAPKNEAGQFRNEVFGLERIRENADLSNTPQSIRRYRDRVIEELYQSNVSDSRYFFVVHFIKRKEQENSKDSFITKCRHSDLRENSKKAANALAQDLANNYDLRKRVKGIDGASSEIGCRPEVLSVALRYLRNFNPINTKSHDFQKQERLTIFTTFHAGEDFLDLIDGLRAIDETILFLNLKRNDRLGHALALGVDAEDYYKSKNFNLVMPKHDLLDNLVWILFKSAEMNICIPSDLKSTIKSKINNLLSEIYKSEHEINLENFNLAWKLRGDDPQYYKSGVYKKAEDYGYNQYAVWSVNPKINDSIRKNQKASQLYYKYHFDCDVKKKGAEITAYKMEPGLIAIVKQVQTKMQFEIEKSGIAIECNPTSNYLIGTFKRMDKHPIFQFHNSQLEIYPEKLEKSPQLSVSINTDDQGVFDTCIETEYAVLAACLEKAVDENGNQKYNSDRIISWLDKVRQMGLEQIFN